MAVETLVAGTTTVKIQRTTGGIATLGYCRNAPEIGLVPYVLDVPSDENGGEQGPPSEIQLLGLGATIQLRMTKLDAAVLADIERIAGLATAGTPPTAGTLLFAGSNTFRLILDNVNRPRNFPFCVLRTPMSHNIGSQFTEYVLEFFAYKSGAGVLWNTSVS